MTNRTKLSKKFAAHTSQFLKQNREIGKALELFDLSYDQYRKATEGSHFTTEVSTNPKSSNH